jgi:hypothetical protein
MIATLRSTGAILALAWMVQGAQPAAPAAAPKSRAVAIADSIVSRNPGAPRDRLARWSYVTGYAWFLVRRPASRRVSTRRARVRAPRQDGKVIS